MRKTAGICCLFLVCTWFIRAQESQLGSQSDRAALERLRLAVSSLDYPVTPGDEYRLVYRQTSDALITRDLRVEADCTIDLGIFGKVNAYRLSFIELKQSVEALIQSGYTRSMPSLSITAPGVFRISVRGDLRQASYISVWGLSRLSDVVLEVKEEYSSLRNVEIISATGEHRKYDLLRALRLGVSEQDPYVRPGDVIVLYRAKRTIKLSGEVHQPGTYELLEGEGIKDLIEFYGQGPTSMANPDRVRVDRNSTGKGSAEYYSISRAYDDDVALKDGDAVIVAARNAQSSVVWFVGAVSVPSESGAGGTDVASADAAANAPSAAAAARRAGAVTAVNRFSRPIHDGEYLSDVLNEISDMILPAADLAGGLLFREGSAEAVPVNIAGLLSGSPTVTDMMLSSNDVIYLPELRSTVTVAGAVINAGAFPYQPGAPATYYISLAGGFDPERNKGGLCRVYGPTGKLRRSKEPIMAGDQVFAPSNDLGYQIERNAPLLVTIATVLVNITTLYFTLTDR